MKRFVREFANYEIKRLKYELFLDPADVDERTERINKVVEAFEKQMISAAEACWCIAEQTR